MYKNKRIGVIVPSFNEERFIGNVIGTMPEFVDKIFVVNDASTDQTGAIAESAAKSNDRVLLINREQRGGVGAAIITGHLKAIDEQMDVMAVMAGDGQMDPEYLSRIIGPVVDGVADYAKGNRLSNRLDREEMPIWRSLGNLILTTLNRISTGYYKISDPQNGYTAVAAETLKKLDLRRIENGYAFENDMLTKLNCINARVVDVPHPALYRGQKSKIRYPKFIMRTSWILVKGFLWRIWQKYFLKLFRKTKT